MLPSDYFTHIPLDQNYGLYISQLPIPAFCLDYTAFQQLWDAHPPEFHTIQMHGKNLLTPRWQQAYGKNYSYSGSRNNALPMSSALQPFLDWCQTHVHPNLNGLLLNWYDGAQGHYIGAHRDDMRELLPGTPIVTISLGQERVFRMRPYNAQGFKDLTLSHGDVVVIPYDTNVHWTHEVPHFKKYQGKRISVTIRAFNT